MEFDEEQKLEDFFGCRPVPLHPKSTESVLGCIAVRRNRLPSHTLQSLNLHYPSVSGKHPTFGSLTFSPDTTKYKRMQRMTDIPYATSSRGSVSKPAIIPAIKAFSRPDAGQSLCLFIAATNQRDACFDMEACRYKALQLNEVEVDWLELATEHTQSGRWQSGEICLDFNSEPACSIKTDIRFSNPFLTTPEVVVWLSGIEAPSSNKKLRIRCGVSKGQTTDEGAEIYVESWGCSSLNSVKVSWVAYDSKLLGVHSGSIDTNSLRPEKIPQHFNTGYIEFPPEKFKKTPKVMVGFSMLCLCNKKQMNVKTFASNGREFNFLSKQYQY
ncbi:hypothetical protein BJ508DRAFT_329206 [Ascobolus immersus RN42]|uniref:H-type lectin domain-containing protein n=1 Tax=Ascobolus immersus RN42 TaxID=1160509 RepID=A0A3N4HZ22_ASCIM|nr:hypothetical protein BJ508DRAFT_329206 [Ascobolus immersus RN42]